MILKNTETYIYKITLLVVLILLVLFLSRNFLFSSFNDSVRPVANAVALSVIEYEKRAEQSRPQNSYVQTISQNLKNSALPLTNLFVSVFLCRLDLAALGFGGTEAIVHLKV